MARCLVLLIAFLALVDAITQIASAANTTKQQLTFSLSGTYIAGASVRAAGTITPFGNAGLDASISDTSAFLIFTFDVDSESPPRCCGASFSVYGDSISGTGQASPGSGGCVLNVTITGGTGVFQTVSGTLALKYSPCGPDIPPTGTIQLDGTGSIVVPCELPTSETTAFDGWSQSIGLWKQTLISDDGIDFAGETVKEANAAPAVDTCWFPGSMIAETNEVTGGEWAVNTDNTWADDKIGPFPNAVTYYRSQHRTPCGATVFQQMTITCRATGATYNYGPINTLRAIITTYGVESGRAGSLATRRYP